MPLNCIACGELLSEEDKKQIPVEDEVGICIVCTDSYYHASGSEVWDEEDIETEDESTSTPGEI